MILLISDLHLQENRPDISRAFFRFLHEKAAQASSLYILGDFFEVWIGDDAISEFQQQVAQALLQLTKNGTQVYAMHGNRDFMLGKKFCQLAGCQLLPDPAFLTLDNQRFLLSHGDAFCTDDRDYQRMKRLLRNPFSLFLLRHSPLSFRRKLASDLRQQSKSRTRAKPMQITDVNPEAITACMQKHHIKTLIHGHTHRPAIHSLDNSTQRIVLGDWDTQGWYVQLDDQGIQLLEFPFTA